jgi:hypothetical protein
MGLQGELWQLFVAIMLAQHRGEGAAFYSPWKVGGDASWCDYLRKRSAHLHPRPPTKRSRTDKWEGGVKEVGGRKPKQACPVPPTDKVAAGADADDCNEKREQMPAEQNSPVPRQ